MTARLSALPGRPPPRTPPGYPAPVRWLAMGTYDVDRHPRVGVLLEGLTAWGDEVAEADEPLPLDTAGRVRMLQQPWRLPLLAAQLARCWWLVARRARREARGGRPDAVLVGYLGHFDVHLARLLFPRTPIVLDHLVSAAGTAADRGLSRGARVRHRLLRVIDAAALARADVVVVDTAEHLAALPEAARGRALVVPVGAARAWFEAGRAEREPRSGDVPLRVVFAGLFTPLQGTPVIGAALAGLAGEPVQVTMIGSGQDAAECRRLAAPNTAVTWREWVPADELPDVVAGHDVSLGIFGTTPKALAVVPTKVYQGAAAGCAVVTSDTPPQRAALDGAAVLVAPGDAGALAQALRALAAEPGRAAALGATARARAEQAFGPRAVVAALRSRTETLMETGR
jgi:glycosyltransferase involved in cell wall biosynthesis